MADVNIRSGNQKTQSERSKNTEPTPHSHFFPPISLFALPKQSNPVTEHSDSYHTTFYNTLSPLRSLKKAPMAPLFSPTHNRRLLLLSTFVVLFILSGGGGVGVGGRTVVLVEGNWCVARSDASNQALQTALDYACGAGADCSPIQSSGLCYLPNTIQAHASYAFDSYFQRKGMAPGSCDFAGTATVARTDPSYGSCVFPSSASTAGGTTGTAPTTTSSSPTTLTPPATTTTTPTYGGGTTGLNPAGTTPSLPTDNSKASWSLAVPKMLMPLSFLLALS